LALSGCRSSQCPPPHRHRGYDSPHSNEEAAMLAARDLWKSYGTKAAVEGVTLEARAGEIVGLLGPNGAGKSTTVAMICGLTHPDRGAVTIDGAAMGDDASPAKRRVGLVPQDISLFEDLSALGNLELFGSLYGVKGVALRERSAAALELVGLSDRARAKPSTFSGGMKRRLNIACALVHDPDVLVLDEPTAGVDPQSRNAIFDNLETLRTRGKAIVYTTHYMEEAERLCDRVMIMDHGKVVASGTLDDLRRMAPAPPPKPVVGASLEDVFLHLTGRQLRD
jgi:ABC-2 type transport system ATP-binding protein